MCVLDGPSQSSGFITTLRTDVDVGWTHRRRNISCSWWHDGLSTDPGSASGQRFVKEPLCEPYPSSVAPVATYVPEWTSDHFLYSFLCLSFFPSFCDDEQDASTAEWGGWRRGEAFSSSSVMLDAVIFRVSWLSPEVLQVEQLGNFQILLRTRLIRMKLLSWFSLYLPFSFTFESIYLSIFCCFT